MLLQRESKYSHEIRRSEQENTKLKERLLKVLMEKGEGRGTGNFLELDPSLARAATGAPSRGKWTTQGSKDEDVITKVIGKLSFETFLIILYFNYKESCQFFLYLVNTFNSFLAFKESR